MERSRQTKKKTFFAGYTSLRLPFLSAQRSKGLLETLVFADYISGLFITSLKQSVSQSINVRRLPGLNGLRAIAALVVMYSHLCMELETFNLPLLFGRDGNGHPTGMQASRYAVYIFFVLSGFLITHLLLAEKSRGRVDVPKFYLRRLLRIWPLYYFYLALVFVAYAFFTIEHPATLPYYLFFAANVPFLLQSILPLVGHYWSLGVEEQFYLFWPWVADRTGTRLLAVTLSLIAAIVGAKLFVHFVLDSNFGRDLVTTFPFHLMLIGAVGAILYRQKNRWFLAFVDNKVTQALVWICYGTIIVNRFHIASVLDPEIISCLTVALIVGQINSKNRLVDLESRLLNFLGKISYGIYMYHPLLIFLSAKVIAPLALPVFVKYMMTYGFVTFFTVGVSALSYRYFESYFLKQKDRYAVVNIVPAGNTAVSRPTTANPVY